MQLFLLGLGILSLVGVWHFMIRKTILDHHRDRLFDLRDELRATFVQNGWDLNSPVYARLRLLTNGHLRSTEFYDFIPFRYLEYHVQQKPQLMAALRAEFEGQFDVDDPELQTFINQYRERALGIMLEYMISSASPAMLLCCALVPLVMLGEAIGYVGRGAVSFARAFSWLCDVLAGWAFKKEIVEEYSFRLGNTRGDDLARLRAV
jgi:hypothetical protein